MRIFDNTEFRAVLATGVAMLAFAPVLASAQQAAAPATDTTSAASPADDAKARDEIVVTGTLIRGQAPVGSNEITLGQQTIEQTAPMSGNELLATLPQVSNYFNKDPLTDLGGAVNQFNVSRPNIRNLSINTAASSATLVLLDGHRVASIGVNQSSADPDMFPTSAIDHVEVVTEGGSSTYGADAVAGVINFITKKRFDGFKVDGHYGFADNYWQTDGSVTAGKDWGSGSAYIAYTFTKNSNLMGYDRSYVHQDDFTTQPYTPIGRACASPNLAVNSVLTAYNYTLSSVNYAAPGYAPNTINSCDLGRDKSLVPEAERNGVMASLFQELDSATTVTIKAFYSKRTTTSTQTFTGQANVTAANPYAAAALPAGLVLGSIGHGITNLAQASFSYGPAVGYDTDHPFTVAEEGGVNAELDHDLGKNWQVRGLLNWSDSNTRIGLPQANAALESVAGVASTTATALDPFNIAATNPAVIANILNNEIAGQAKDDLTDLRGVVEGKLITLPGGDVRVAAGYEFMRDQFEQRYESDIPIGSLNSYPFNNYNRDVNSLFGEIHLPLIGRDNAMTLIRAFEISASVRYDHYSDFGGTTNPKVGANLKPFDWLTLRGNWGTSFTAPTPLDQLGSKTNSVEAFPLVGFLPTGVAAPTNGGYTVAVFGSVAGLKPQTATTWSLGFDMAPPIIPGLRTSLNYYNVNFKNILSTPVVDASVVANFPNQIQFSSTGLSAAQLRSFETLASNGATVIEPLISGGTPVDEAVDFRTDNFGIYKVAGLDFTVDYRHKTGFGSVDLNVYGDYELERKQQVSPQSGVIDNLGKNFNPQFELQVSGGVTIGTLRGQVTWNHTSGYGLNPSVDSDPVQTRVSPFDTINLFFKYDVPSTSWALRNLSFTLNVNNVFNVSPPIYLETNTNGSSNGYAALTSFTLGRMFILGASKKF